MSYLKESIKTIIYLILEKGLQELKFRNFTYFEGIQNFYFASEFDVVFLN